jgi:hypothetical protein
MMKHQRIAVHGVLDAVTGDRLKIGALPQSDRQGQQPDCLFREM